MSIVNLGDYMDNYKIVVDCENPHSELLKQRAEASESGDMKKYLMIQAELEKRGFPKVSADAIQRVRDNAKVR